MADTDVFGILSLLLAAGGAAYLLRARLASKSAPAQALDEPVIDPATSPTAQKEQRNAPTIPPKLRSPTVPLAAGGKPSHPDRWYRDDLALQEQKEKEAKAAKDKDKDKDKKKPRLGDKTEIMENAPPRVAPASVGKDTLPSEGNISAAKDKDKDSVTASTTKAIPGATSKRGVPSAAKRTLVGPVGPSSLTPNPFADPTSSVSPVAASPPPPAPTSDKKLDDKAPSSQRNLKVPAGSKPGQKTQPQTSTFSTSPEPPSSAPPTQLKGPDPLLKKIEEDARKTREAKKKAQAEIDEIPKIDVEEDEDVEPTKVGKFGRKEIQPPVDKIIFDEGADKPPPKVASSGLKLVIFALAQTDPGKRRKQNEDSMLILEDKELYVVADGMGGHRGGQFASKLAVKTMNDAFTNKRFEASAHADLPEPASELARAIQMSNAAILEEAGAKPDLKGMGTTICAARFTDGMQRLYLGHVGDSRCYRVRDGMMKQMTTDHTMADYGVAGPEGAHLSRALGVWPTVPIDIILAEPKLNDVYLLCSDGLTKMLPDGTIATQLMHEEDPKAAVERLVFFANAHGGKDNITVILLRVVEPGWKPPSSAT